jgi:hypothetical protein
MANKRSRSRKSANSRTKSRRRKQHGGDLGSNPPSAWGYVAGTVGDGLTQLQNALTLQPGQNLASSQSNNIVPIGAPNAQNAQPMLKPNMTGGRRRRRGSAKGGSWGAVAAQALVPGFLLGAQQVYGRRHGSRKHGSRKHGRKH